ncbi:acyltransferase family protein [Xylophilus sp. Kf1]|nr:acyltransferase family protein [Xylophilus sp. Kf1]
MRPSPAPADTVPSFAYIPALDGLRAVAVLIVLVAHVGFYRWVPGGFGVTLFFFVSGMLITRLLLAEQAANGRIAIGLFYLRRLLRLYPALLVSMVLGLAATVVAGGDVLWGKVLAALLYCINYYGIHVGWSQGMQGFDPFGVLWSLAIEEQYYIVFPLICLALATRLRRFTRWVVAAVVLTLIWRVVLVLGGATSDRIYMGTDTRIDSILYGCLLTLLLAASPADGARWLRRLSRRWVMGVALLCLAATFVVRDAFVRDTLRYSVQGLALMPLVASLCFTDALRRVTGWLELPAMRQIGRLSYSLYLLHGVAIALVGAWMRDATGAGSATSVGSWTFVAFVAVTVPLSLAMAWACYHWVEMPFVRLRRRYGSHPVPVREG